MYFSKIDLPLFSTQNELDAQISSVIISIPATCVSKIDLPL